MGRALIPASALESHIAILGKTGAGKSNAAKVVAELLMQDGQRVCAIDPTGTWWGLRLRPDGKPSKFKPVIFGGAHADIAITDQHGAAIAEAIGTSSDSAIVDTREMTVGQRTRLFTAFAEGLLRTNRGPLTLVVDEAHLFAPQGRVADPQSGAMLHAANNLVSLGRGLGLRIILISQRPAKLHKDSLTQVETLVAMKLIAPQDREAVRAWVGEWADPEKGREIISSLPSLQKGDAWVWAPDVDVLERVHFPLAATFDSGKPLAVDQGAPQLEPLNLKSVTAQLAAIQAEAAARDPAKLRKRIAELEAAPAAVDPKLIADAERRAYDSGKTAGIGIGIMRAANAIAALRIPELEVPGLAQANVAETATAIAQRQSEPQKKGAAAVPRAATGADPLLSAAFSIWPVRLTWGALAAICGRKARGGHFNSARKALLDSGAVRMDGDLVTPTAPPAITDRAIPADLLEQKLPQPAAKMFAAIRERPGITVTGLATVLGMQPRGGHWNTGMATLRRNDLLIEQGDGLCIRAELLGEKRDGK